MSSPVESARRSGHLSPHRVRLVLGGLIAGTLLAALDQNIVGTALPRIVSELGGLDQLSWLATAYLLTSTASTPLWGKLSDLYGRRAVYQATIATFLAGSALAAVSTDMLQLVAFRALQGVGGGGLLALAFAVVADMVPPRERGRYMGYLGAVHGVAGVAGPLLGGWFTDGPGWRWIFWINVPVGLVASTVIALALTGSATVRRPAQIDWLGVSMIVAGVAAIVMYLSWRGPEYGWTEFWALVLLGLGLVLTAAFVVVESKAPDPVVPMRLFRGSIFRTGSLFGFLFGFSMFGVMVFVPLYLQAVRGMSATGSGLAMVSMVTGFIAASVAAGRLMSSTGRYKVFPLVGSAVVLGSLIPLSNLAADTSMWLLCGCLFAFGTGLGCSTQTVTTAVLNAVPVPDIGAATATVGFSRQLGGTVGTAVFGAVLAGRLGDNLARSVPPEVLAGLPANGLEDVEFIRHLQAPVREPVVNAYAEALNDTLLIGVPFAALAFVVILFLKETPLATR